MGGESCSHIALPPGHRLFLTPAQAPHAGPQIQPPTRATWFEPATALGAGFTGALIIVCEVMAAPPVPRRTGLALANPVDVALLGPEAWLADPAKYWAVQSSCQTPSPLAGRFQASQDDRSETR